ncbi:MAG: Holliday junction branch migration protein RuvA [Patescibacteria group bacterium]|nr:Holliday junction branch migration protein RuvA [Patescibacteria group bacterium]
MIYSISGKLIAKKQNFAVVEANGIGFKIFVGLRTLRQSPKIGGKASFFCYTSVKQDGIELYGFLTEKELEIFELLLSADGVGPKAGMKILDIAKIDSLLAAIKQGRSDLLTKAAGIGDKKAQRIVLELKDKIKHYKSNEEVALMETDADIEKALKNLGYKQAEIREAVKNIPSKIKKIEDRLKTALKFLSK